MIHSLWKAAWKELAPTLLAGQLPAGSSIVPAQGGCGLLMLKPGGTKGKDFRSVFSCFIRSGLELVWPQMGQVSPQMEACKVALGE